MDNNPRYNMLFFVLLKSLSLIMIKKCSVCAKKCLVFLLLSCHCRIFAYYWSILYDFKSAKRIKHKTVATNS